jgi:hypothetical protein
MAAVFLMSLHFLPSPGRFSSYQRSHPLSLLRSLYSLDRLCSKDVVPPELCQTRTLQRVFSASAITYRALCMKAFSLLRFVLFESSKDSMISSPLAAVSLVHEDTFPPELPFSETLKGFHDSYDSYRVLYT